MTNDILLTRHNQEIAQWSPDPFPRERVGSGHETKFDYTDDHTGEAACITSHMTGSESPLCPASNIDLGVAWEQSSWFHE